MFASSSSVYGDSKIPFKINSTISKPINFYAATKSFNEIAAYSFSKVYKLKFLGFRFFTVYGPWGRPDMMIYKFLDSVYKKKTFKIHNFGDHKRDFTYIDDVTSAIYSAFVKRKKILKSNNFLTLNISSGKMISLKYVINFINKYLKKKQNYQFIKKQLGDINYTLGDISLTKKIISYNPTTNIRAGLIKFINWYLSYNFPK